MPQSATQSNFGKTSFKEIITQTHEFYKVITFDGGESKICRFFNICKIITSVMQSYYSLNFPLKLKCTNIYVPQYLSTPVNIGLRTRLIEDKT